MYEIRRDFRLISTPLMVPTPTAAPATTTVYGPYTLDTGDGNWSGLTFVQNFAAANLGAAVGTQVRLTVNLTTFVAGGTIVVYFDRQGTDLFDFKGDGTKTHILFGGTDITANGSTLEYVSDWCNLGEAYDGSLAYVCAAEFTGTNAVIAYKTDGPSGEHNYFKSGAEAATADKSGYGGNRNDVAEFISKIEIR